MKKQIMNVVNFVRGIEPRWEMDLYAPVVNEIEVNKKYHIPSTFLLALQTARKEKFSLKKDALFLKSFLCPMKLASPKIVLFMRKIISLHMNIMDIPIKSKLREK